MRRHHTGSGQRTTIHPDWQTHHATVVEGTMSGTVALRQSGGTPGWNPATQQNEMVPHPAYAAVSCRVQALTGVARVVATADDEEIVADYLIAVPRSVDGVVEGHRADVTDTGDLDLDGKTLRVVRVVRGTHRFERDLFCTLTD